jgi:plasmid maintenance system antidote protein VapI
MTDNLPAIPPAETFHVGEYIQDALDARDWTVDDLASRMSGDFAVNKLTIELHLGILDKNCYMSKETSRQIGYAFGVSPDLFYKLDCAWRGAEPEVEKGKV